MYHYEMELNLSENVQVLSKIKKINQDSLKVTNEKGVSYEIHRQKFENRSSIRLLV
jgi:hypothetical protein